MGLASEGKSPVVEESPDAPSEPDLTTRALQVRIRQQEILAELGVIALRSASLDALLDEAARLTAAGLEAEFCKVMQYLPDENQLLVRAGVGWGEGVLGRARSARTWRLQPGLPCAPASPSSQITWRMRIDSGHPSSSAGLGSGAP